MSIYTVKDNMFNAMLKIDQLSNNIKQLNSIIKNTNGDNIPTLINFISSTDFILSDTETSIDKMYMINSIELDIFFSEFNRDTNKVKTELELYKNHLTGLKSQCIKINTMIKYLKVATYNFKPSTIKLNFLSSMYVPLFNKFEKSLTSFKSNIDKHNNKLIIGVRE
jgi:hypothetical protein